MVLMAHPLASRLGRWLSKGASHRAAAPQVPNSAAVYQLPGRYIVCPVCQTTAGLGLSTEPFQVLPAQASAQVLGQAVLAALDASARLVPHPEDWKAHAVPLLQSAGMKSHAALQRQAQLVQVERHVEHVLAIPHRSGGTRGDVKGFLPLLDQAVVLSSLDAEAVGLAVRDALARCVGGGLPS